MISIDLLLVLIILSSNSIIILYSFSIFPKSLSNSSIRCNNLTLTMLFTIFPFSFIHFSVRIFHPALSILLSINKISFNFSCLNKSNLLFVLFYLGISYYQDRQALLIHASEIITIILCKNCHLKR